MSPLRQAIATATLVLGVLAQTGFARAEAYLRVVDVGSGLCVIAKAPDGEIMLYDAGHRSDECYNALAELAPDRVVHLAVISHNDADHIGEMVDILRDFEVRRIVHTGDARTNAGITAMRQAIARESAIVHNLRRPVSTPLAFGRYFNLGLTQARFMAGWGDWRDAVADGEPALSDAEKRNVVSIVMRYTYNGRSVLLTGDTIGRRQGQADGACFYAERRMWEDRVDIPIQSDILIGQHHGGNNSSAQCFIDAVDPTYVVFSAGHSHAHPREDAVLRFANVPDAQVLRTDRGDDEGAREWGYRRIEGCRDPRADDDVEIILPDEADAEIIVRYRNANPPCPRR